MSDQGDSTALPPALSTKLEEDFVSPLTAVRGLLEILRDFPNLDDAKRQHFISNALDECRRLERGVDDLATTVYAAAQVAATRLTEKTTPSEPRLYGNRINVLEDHQTIEVDFSNFEFNSSSAVNKFYDELENLVIQSGKSWYFIVDYSNCSVWPEAWVAFAHRGKKINANHSLGTLRLARDSDDLSGADHNRDESTKEVFDSFESARDYIDRIRKS